MSELAVKRDSGVDYWYARFYQVSSEEKKTKAASNDQEKIEFGRKVKNQLNEILGEIEETAGGKFIEPFDNKKNKTDKVFFDEDLIRFIFPSLEVISENEAWKNTEVRIDVNPCIGQSPVTKIYVAPRHVGDCNISRLFNYFSEFEEKTSIIFDRVAFHYFSIMMEMQKEYPDLLRGHDFSSVETYEIRAHIVGGNDFGDLVKHAKDRRRLRDIKNNNEDIGFLFNNVFTEAACRTSGDIYLPDYKWYLRSIWQRIENKPSESQAIKGYLAFYGDEKKGHFIGVADGNPHEFAKGFLARITRDL